MGSFSQEYCQAKIIVEDNGPASQKDVPKVFGVIFFPKFGKGKVQEAARYRYFWYNLAMQTTAKGAKLELKK